MRRRWSELLSAVDELPESAQAWTPLSKVFSELYFHFLNNVDSRFACEYDRGFTRKRELDEPRVVVIDPEVSFGKPVLVGTGIPTSTVAERYKAGESVDDLAEDYDLERAKIEEAIRCELRAA